MRCDDHHALRDDDRHGDKAGAVTLLSGDDRQTVERQHRRIAQMKQRQRSGQYKQRLAFEQDPPGACRLPTAVVVEPRAT